MRLCADSLEAALNGAVSRRSTFVTLPFMLAARTNVRFRPIADTAPSPGGASADCAARPEGGVIFWRKAHNLIRVAGVSAVASSLLDRVKMTRFLECLIVCALAIAALLLPSAALGQSSQVKPTDAAHPAGLPAIGKWLIGQDGSIAHWLGEIVDGKTLREPINVIILDSLSKNPEEAVKRIESASAAAGYPIRKGHSTGYRALIAGKLFPQLPKGLDTAFSNNIYEMNNNHGRLFGPYQLGANYLFTGAFSREVVRLKMPHHGFGSFNQARDDFARQLTLKSEFKLSGFVNLDNAIVGNSRIGTGDHDGVAALLQTDQR